VKVVFRSLAAIASGFGVTALTVGLLTPVTMRAFGVTGRESLNMGYFAVHLGYTVLATLAGGYVAALVARSHEMPHAAAIGMLLIFMSFLSMREHAQSRPDWYELTVAGCGPIAAMVGAALRMLTK
jgi:hypothetical protein